MHIWTRRWIRRRLAPLYSRPAARSDTLSVATMTDLYSSRDAIPDHREGRSIRIAWNDEHELLTVG
jgi:hypothetical protein